MPKKERSPELTRAIDQMKHEILSELGYCYLDGSVPSRVCGYVGGRITQMLIVIGEQAIVAQFKRSKGIQ